MEQFTVLVLDILWFLISSTDGLGVLLYFWFPSNPIWYIFLHQCDLVLDAAHRKSPEPSIAPRKEDIVESIIFKASDVVVVTFKDVDLNFARKGTDRYYLGSQATLLICLVLGSVR